LDFQVIDFSSGAGTPPRIAPCVGELYLKEFGLVLGLLACVADVINRSPQQDGGALDEAAGWRVK
jgi:hypothetical protein